MQKGPQITVSKAKASSGVLLVTLQVEARPGVFCHFFVTFTPSKEYGFFSDYDPSEDVYTAAVKIAGTDDTHETGPILYGLDDDVATWLDLNEKDVFNAFSRFVV